MSILDAVFSDIDAKNIASFGGAGLKQLIRRNNIGFSMILPKL